MRLDCAQDRLRLGLVENDVGGRLGHQPRRENPRAVRHRRAAEMNGVGPLRRPTSRKWVSGSPRSDGPPRRPLSDRSCRPSRECRRVRCGSSGRSGQKRTRPYRTGQARTQLAIAIAANALPQLWRARAEAPDLILETAMIEQAFDIGVVHEGGIIYLPLCCAH